MAAAGALPFDAASSVWADITPVPQDDGPAPLCPILYSPSYAQAMDLIRALLPADELSPRALALTEHLSKMCPSSYTIWHYRARILIHGPENGPNGLGSVRARLEAELDYLDDLATKNMKNYQVWQHRKLIVSALGDASKELGFIAKVLQVDSKNYHTWVYRQWVLSHFGGLAQQTNSGMRGSPKLGAAEYSHLWRGELDFVNELLGEDVRNNSAWSHRYFCIFGSGWARRGVDKCQEWWKIGQSWESVIQGEISFAKGHIVTIPHNASAWNYLRGVVQLQEAGNVFACAVAMAKVLVPTAEEASSNPAVDAGGNTPSLALEWLLDDAQAETEAKRSDADRQEAIKQAEAYVNRLCIADPIRKRYWQYRLMVIRKASGKSV